MHATLLCKQRCSWWLKDDCLTTQCHWRINSATEYCDDISPVNLAQLCCCCRWDPCKNTLALSSHVWPGSFTAPSPKAMCAAARFIVVSYVSKTGVSSWAWCYACKIAGTPPLVITYENQNKILLPGRANCLLIYFVRPLLGILHRKDTLKCEQEPRDSLSAGRRCAEKARVQADTAHTAQVRAAGCGCSSVLPSVVTVTTDISASAKSSVLSATVTDLGIEQNSLTYPTSWDKTS